MPTLAPLALVVVLSGPLCSLSDSVSGVPHSAAGAICAAENVRAEDLDGLMTKVRAALNVDEARPMLQVSGQCTRFGMPSPFRWTFSPEGPFLREFKGAFAQQLGDDGTEAWAQEVRSPSFPVVSTERARLQAIAWVWSGAWCQKNGPYDLELAANGAEAGPRVLLFQSKAGTLSGTIQLDSKSHYPIQLAFDPEHGAGQVTFEDWQLAGEFPMPSKVTIAPGIEEPLVLEVTDTRTWIRTAPPFANPHSTATDCGFLENVKPDLHAQQLPGLGWVVTPKIDGKERGAFLLDPGSPNSLMTKGLGRALGYRPFGSSQGMLRGSFQDSDSKDEGLYQSRFLELGPFLLEGPRYVVVDRIPGLPTANEAECQGVLGWDVFLRSVVIFDAAAKTVELHDPESFDGTGVRWSAMQLVGRVPHLSLQLDADTQVLVRFDARVVGKEVLLSREVPTLSAVSLVGYPVQTKRLEPGNGSRFQGTPNVRAVVGPQALPGGALIFDYANGRLGTR